MGLEQFADLIILIAAVLVAVTNIWKFFVNSGKGIRKKVTEVSEDKEKEFNDKVDARVKEVAQPMLDQQAKTLTASFEGLLDKYLPDRLVMHDHETREKYLKDRENYLREITNEVVVKMQNQLEAVDTHEQRMTVFSEVLKELLRERIMAIYGRNMLRRQLEEHEKIELDRAYSSYKAMGGNSYIDDYYARMRTWDVIPDDND